jgi:MSHA biogenesis protein MshO
MRWHRRLGFTLVELMLVIVLLGILAVSVTRYLEFGVGMYSQSTAVQHTLQQGRFALERVSRELRQATPNSIRIGDNALLGLSCLEFVPIAQSGVYQNLPLFPLRRDWMSILTLDTQWRAQAGDRITVYPTDPSHIYQTTQLRTVTLANQDMDDGDNNVHTQQVRLAAQAGVAATFATESPQRRFYLLAQPVSYCRSGSQLYRYSNYGFQVAQPIPPVSNAELMADGITNTSTEPVFRYDSPVLTRNAVVHLFWRFSLPQQQPDLFFNHEVHLPNVP